MTTTGLVVVSRGPEAALRVAGLTTVLRAVLGLQKAGCGAVALLGVEAAAWASEVSADDRVTVPVEAVDAVPTGALLVVRDDAVLDPRALSALARAPGFRTAGGEVLAVHRVAWEGGAAVLDPAGLDAAPSEGVAVPVRDAAEADAATDTLLQSLRKPQDGMVSRRHQPHALPRRHAACSAARGMRPNHGLRGHPGGRRGGGRVAARRAARRGPCSPSGGLLFQAQSVLDGCDGELARLTFRGSKAGEWIDTVGDDLTNYAFFAGMPRGGCTAAAAPRPLAAGASARRGRASRALVASAIEYRYLLALGSGDLAEVPVGIRGRGRRRRGARGGGLGGARGGHGAAPVQAGLLRVRDDAGEPSRGLARRWACSGRLQAARR
jgi:hypothetical protein